MFFFFRFGIVKIVLMIRVVLIGVYWLKEYWVFSGGDKL